MSPELSWFRQGHAQGMKDVRRTLDFTAAGAMSTSFPAVPLSDRERRDFLRGYVTGMLFALSTSRPRRDDTPAVPQERDETKGKRETP